MVAIRFASGLEAGSVTAVSIALVFFQLPFGIFSVSIVNVLYPRMSSQAAREDFSGLTESVQYGLRFLFAALIPSAVFLCLTSTQLISVGFLKGEFTYETVLLASPVLVYYSIGLVSVGFFTFLQRVCYSLNEYKVPFYIAVLLAGIDVGLSLWLKETVLRAGGIALANSIAFTLGSVLLVIFVRSRLGGGIEGRKILVTLFKVAVSSAPAGACIVLFNKFFGQWWEQGRTAIAFLIVFAVAAVFCAIVVGFYYITKVQMLKDLAGGFRRRLK
jgi:putative peptidoglycan lipid II flippase